MPKSPTFRVNRVKSRDRAIAAIRRSIVPTRRFCEVKSRKIEEAASSKGRTGLSANASITRECEIG